MSDSRDRFYTHYVHCRSELLAPESLDGLGPRESYLNKLIRDHFPPDRKAAILDVGCGHGALIHFARQNDYKNITGFDRSPQQVAEAKRLGIAGVEQRDLMKALRSYDDQSLDVVVAHDVIEHFTKDELLRFVDEVYRVLREDGRWIIHTPNGESPFSGRIRYGDITHELAFTRESMSQLLLASGFSPVHCYEDAPIPHGVKSALRWVLWKAIRGVLRAYLVIETGAGRKECILTQNFLTVAIK